MKITKTPTSFVFDIPRIAKRSNPYDDDYHPEYDCIAGLIIHHKGHSNECGFAHVIDLEYKGKADQISDFIVKWHEGEKEFKLECNRLGLDIFEITI